MTDDPAPQFYEVRPGAPADAGPPDLTSLDDEDWFGEGSAFDSSEDLAAALLAMMGDGNSEPQNLEFHEVAAGNPQEELQSPSTPIMFEPTRKEAPKPPWEGQPTVGWAVASGLAAKRAGKREWSFRNGILAMRKTEDAMAQLRRAAIEVTWAAANTVLVEAQASGVKVLR